MRKSFKKALSLVLALTLLMSMVCISNFAVSAESTQYRLGDANTDGSVDVMDATTIQQIAAVLVTPTDDQLYLADVTGDGEVDIRDATLIQQYIAMLISDAPTNADGYKIGDLVTLGENPTSPSTSSSEETQATTETAKVVKFTDNQGWGEAFAYFWCDEYPDMAGEWPGKAMTKEGTNEYGQDIYSTEIPAGATMVTFSGNGQQTVDIPLTDAEGYYTDGTVDDKGHFYAFPWASEPATSEDTQPTSESEEETSEETQSSSEEQTVTYGLHLGKPDGSGWNTNAMTTEG
ncbi:MAG: dockerin type I domain-containing protein, partial [Ruminococcus sp.]